MGLFGRKKRAAAPAPAQKRWSDWYETGEIYEKDHYVFELTTGERREITTSLVKTQRHNLDDPSEIQRHWDWDWLVCVHEEDNYGNRLDGYLVKTRDGGSTFFPNANIVSATRTYLK